jgi:hypothetical protein
MLTAPPGDDRGMSQAWGGLAGREVAESDGEPVCSSRVTDDQLLPTGQSIPRGFFVGRVFDTEEQGNRGVPMGLQPEPVAPRRPIADAKRLQEGIAIAHVVPQAGRRVPPGLESDGHRRGRGVMVGENDEDKGPLDTHLAGFDCERQRGDPFPRQKRRGLGWLRRGEEDSTREAKNGAESKGFHGMPSMGAQRSRCWETTEDLGTNESRSG